MRCKKCKYEVVSSVKSMINTEISSDLARGQASLGAIRIYRDGENTLSLFSAGERAINNHERIKHVSETVGVVVGVTTKEEKK